MKEKIKRIDIVPAKLLEYRSDGNVLLKCLQGNTTVDRAFEPKTLNNIKSPNLLFIGVETGDNMMKIKVIDGSEYEELFHEKWNLLFK